MQETGWPEKQEPCLVPSRPNSLTSGWNHAARCRLTWCLSHTSEMYKSLPYSDYCKLWIFCSQRLGTGKMKSTFLHFLPLPRCQSNPATSTQVGWVPQNQKWKPQPPYALMLPASPMLLSSVPQAAQKRAGGASAPPWQCQMPQPPSGAAEGPGSCFQLGLRLQISSGAQTSKDSQG